MNFYMDIEIDAETVEEAMEIAAREAAQHWHRQVEWQKEMDARPPAPPSKYDFLDNSLVEMWSKRLLEEITRQTFAPRFEDDKTATE